ncbi:MAG: DNA repair ATPase [Planctomycetaceae bacterium]
MSDTGAESTPQTTLEGSTYEILRQRLSNHAGELRKRLDRLNAQRKSVFGSIDQSLLATERITTDNNCVPRDMVAVGSSVLLGYNVQFGLKTERNVADVFSVFTFDQESRVLHARDNNLLSDAQFQKDFQDIYRYYKNATFSKFFLTNTHLFMVFQVGPSTSDVKTFKWAIQGEGLVYVDNRSDHEVRYPAQHEFTWKRTTRDLHRPGLHPHISIDDRIFVETVGGDLTIKVENNTASGAGIYSEPVDDVDQTLDDADIAYAIVGNCILLRVRPYQERNYRYIVYNEKIQQAVRIDALADSCVLLPDDHGLIFSNGYYLQTGEHKMFESVIQGLLFERRIHSPNGEDTLFVFYQPESGMYVLLGYNIIEQRVATPVVCHGFTKFDAGEMVLFRSQEQPQKHHAIQIWQTPYVSADFVPHQTADSFLYKVGNRDIVRGMSECHEILGLVAKEDTYSGLYVDLVQRSTDVLDSYFWIAKEEAENLGEPLRNIRDAAQSAVDEFEKVTRVRKSTRESFQKVSNATQETLHSVGRKRFDSMDEFVSALSSMRTLRGEVIALRDLRYVDLEGVQKLEESIQQTTERVSHNCVQFLLKPEALDSYEKRIVEHTAQVPKLTKVSEARALDEHISQTATELEMLIDIVSNLRIDDATQRTAIIDNISAIFSQVNSARAGVKRRSQELAASEGAAEFSSQLKLLNQSVANYLDVCDTPEKCEEFLTKLMVQLEELEGKFAEFDEFLIQLVEKREEVSGAFETRRMQLVERRNQRAQALGTAADRILKGIQSRISSLGSISDIHGYFASDLMVDKVRDIVRQLKELDDTVKADDIESRLKSLREDTVRQLKDKQELFEDGENVLRFGKHRFSVNTQVLDLTTVRRDEQLFLHLTGTEFYERLVDESLNDTRDVWDMDVVSENRSVYRAEYLAFRLLQSQLANRISEADKSTEALAAVQQFMATRYTEAYTKGVHDHDAALLYDAVRTIHRNAGLLRHPSAVRALGRYTWEHRLDEPTRQRLESIYAGLGEVGKHFADSEFNGTHRSKLTAVLAGALRVELEEGGSLAEILDITVDSIEAASAYLFDELTSLDRAVRKQQFIVGHTAFQLNNEFREYLHNHGIEKQYADSMKRVAADVDATLELNISWLQGYLRHQSNTDAASHIAEAALLLMEKSVDQRRVISIATSQELSGLIGTHPKVLEGGKYALNYHEFMQRLGHFARRTVPMFEQYHQVKSQLVDDARSAMKLSEFQPRVLSTFVRNKLIDEVYLPLVGDNLAKQIGTAGDTKRTDRQGLLLLISPPGYGKTTLMEYIANRLGIIFMKINGPALGHSVTSLDPAAAPNAGAREEVEKLNLALEMGDNVMIYLDDIQHCHPEFLQKFISLCDSQRKIEGVWKGKTRTYDFRGKKVAVVMAGNPYTESGETFQIPDMLANRADIYNLGEIIGDSSTAFEMSYLENSLTSNSVLARLASRSQKDVYSIIKLADQYRQGQGNAPLNFEGIDFEGNYSLEELNEFVSTMAKLMRVRDVVLRVNQEYIDSAAQHDDYRTEPPFLLQGSYRNMNRIAEKVLPVMNDGEVEQLIITSYQNDAQTLTTGTEANLLKFKQMLGILSEEEQQRWDSICKTFRQNVRLRGTGQENEVGQILASLMTVGDGLHGIQQTLEGAMKSLGKSQDERLLNQITAISERLETGLEKIAEVTGRAVVPTEAEPARPRAVQEDQLTIVNRIPKTMMNVLQSQFDLMEGWLKPLTEMTRQQSTDLKDLRPQIEDCLKHYRTLLSKLDEAHDRESE